MDQKKKQFKDSPSMDASEERIRECMKSIEFNTGPNAEFREELFQDMLKTIEMPRTKHKRKKARGRFKAAGIVGASAAAAALMLVLLVSDPGKETADGPNVPKNPGASQTEEGYGQTNRPETEEFTIYSEGNEEKQEPYRLLDDPSLPFSTYIPDKWSSEPFHTEKVNGIKMHRESDTTNKIEIGILKEGLSETEAMKEYEAFLAALNSEGIDANEQTDGGAGWAVRSDILTGAMSGMSYWGIHGDSYYYILLPSYPDYSERPVLENWLWKDGAKLMEE